MDIFTQNVGQINWEVLVMSKWVNISDERTKTFINTENIVSLELHEKEKYLRMGLSDGNSVMWRATTDEDLKKMTIWFSEFVDSKKLTEPTH